MALAWDDCSDRIAVRASGDLAAAAPILDAPAFSPNIDGLDADPRHCDPMAADLPVAWADMPVAWLVPPQVLGSLDSGLARFRDVTIALLAIVVFLPVLILVSLAIKLDSRGPVLFVHHRIGRGGELFPCLKFRTMAVDADQLLQDLLATCALARAEWAADHKLRNDPRITRVGLFLRKTSLDELPQLFNIVAGQMSIIGPRPIVHAEIERYGIYFESYCRVRPGLTGLWQISGRNDLSYAERVRLDCEYVRTRNFMVDMSILARTVPAVLTSRGSY